jgi:hypothetical protein
MKKFAIIENGIVGGVIVADSDISYMTDLLYIELDINQNVSIGDIFDGKTFISAEYYNG